MPSRLQRVSNIRTAQYNLEQNGVAEKLDRTLVQTVRAISNEHKLTKRLL
jgi:hypothetical protein